MPEAISYEYSRPIDWYHECSLDSVWELAKTLASEIEEIETRRTRSEEEMLKFAFTIRQIILDVYVAYLYDPALSLGFSRTESTYTGDRETPSDVSYNAVIASVDGLTELDFLESVKGINNHHHRSRNVNSRLRATSAFFERIKTGTGLRLHHLSRHDEDALLILKDNDKRAIAFVDTDDTVRMKENLCYINNLIHSSVIDICLSDEQMQEMKETIKSRAGKNVGRAINFSRTSLSRTFNRESFEKGGRFYRGWWQGIPSKYRRYITINGQPTVEIDYKSLSVSLAYAQVGLEKPDGEGYLFEGVHRKSVKRLFNRAFNMSSDRAPDPRDYYPLPEGETYRTVMEKLLEKHQPISGLFFSEVGLYLQYKDSVIAETIMLKLLEEDVVCLPIHDSFLVTRDSLDKLKQVMKSSYTSVTGQRAPHKEIEETAQEEALSEWLVDGRLQGYMERHQW